MTTRIDLMRYLDEVKGWCLGDNLPDTAIVELSDDERLIIETFEHVLIHGPFQPVRIKRGGGLE